MPVPNSKTTTFLSASLRYPTNESSACGLALINGLRPLEAGDKTPPKLLRATMEFICTKRSEEEMTLLKRRLNRCRCDRRNETIKALHPTTRNQMNYGRVGDDVPFDKLLLRLIWVITGHLSRLKPRHFPKSANSRDPPWPSDLEDLCRPTGSCQDIVSTLTQWIQPMYSVGEVYTLYSMLCRFSNQVERELLRSPNIYLKALDI